MARRAERFERSNYRIAQQSRTRNLCALDAAATIGNVRDIARSQDDKLVMTTSAIRKALRPTMTTSYRGQTAQSADRETLPEVNRKNI
jgi:hypothetical protein